MLSVVDPFASLLGGRTIAATNGLESYQAATFQIQWIVNTLCLLARQGAIQVVFDQLKDICDRDLYVRFLHMLFVEHVSPLDCKLDRNLSTTG